MQDPRNEIEDRGYRLNINHLKDFQHLLVKYPSIRFLNNPEYNDYKKGYVRISFGGKGSEMNALSKELFEAGWDWKEQLPRKKWWRRLFHGS